MFFQNVQNKKNEHKARCIVGMNDAVIFDRHYSMTHDVQIWTPMILHGYILFTIIVQQFGPFIQSSLFSIFYHNSISTSFSKNTCEVFFLKFMKFTNSPTFSICYLSYTSQYITLFIFKFFSPIKAPYNDDMMN